MKAQKLLTTVAGALALSKSCTAISPSFSGEDPCPIGCAEAGVSPGNWTVYHSVDRLNYCNSSLILSFSAFSPLDDPKLGQTLRACAIDYIGYNNISQPLPEIHTRTATLAKTTRVQARSTNLTASLNTKQYASAQALWNTESLTPGKVDILGLGRQLQSFLDATDASDGNTFPTIAFIYDSLSFTSIGIYASTGVPTSPLISALSSFASSQQYTGGALIQGCSAPQINGTMASNASSFNDNDYTTASAAGIVTASGPHSLAEAQRAVSQWANSSCVTEGYTQASTLPTVLQTISLTQKNVVAERDESEVQLAKRGTCSTATVQSGDLCADLAKKCGISTADLLKYNSKSNFCTTLRVPQLVCCSSGSLPVPEADSNGNCKPHEVQADENCWSIANDNSLLFSVDDLEDFNKNTWGWGGCKNLQASTIICLSPGSPPLPKPVPGAMCGPVKPGTAAPPHGTDLATLNTCPLNSCCDVWGFCGTTDEFCRPVLAGQAPGAPQPIGAPNCISNCGTDIVNNGSPPHSFISIGYFEGYGISRRCQAVDIRNIDMSKYTHIHFAFATMTPSDYQVDMSPIINQYYYFKRITGPKKILSFGGWTFSTDPATYGIFREGVLGANRDRMAQNIASFIIDEGLDGVDIDWEYPAAPDLPDIPTGDPEEGENYYLFLKKLRSILPSDRSISFAAPASFWYLRGFPVAKIIDIVDYVVYMTYDLHGQWDYGNKWTDSGCPGGNCLRSHLNATETLNALSMITKAGVPTNKIAVGIASYGRSFQMTDPRCTGPMCTYTGRESGATPGSCTKTAGYISNAEIRDILATNPTAGTFSDGEKADILVYDGDQWVSYMADDTRARRIDLYRAMNFLGTSDWAISLDNVGLVDQDSGGDYWDDDSDDSGDLGLGSFPGLVFKEEKRKLGKGAVQPKLHKNCKKYESSMRQSWRESGEIADATREYAPDSHLQRALDIYFGGGSAKESQLFANNFDRLWESHWGLLKQNKGQPQSLGMNIHATFFCGNDLYPEIWGPGAPYTNDCPLGSPPNGGKAAVTYQFSKDNAKDSKVSTVWCDLATNHPSTFSLEKAENEADNYHYHLDVINMWKQQVRPFMFYHESVHWKRISKPWIGTSVGHRKDGQDIWEKYDLKDIMSLTYEQRKSNADNWALAAMAMWIMEEWGGDVPVPVFTNKRDEISETSEMDNDAWMAELDKRQKLYDEKHDEAIINPADFEPLFKEGELTYKVNSCNMTTHEQQYKREEFRDDFANNNMSGWKVYSGQFHVSPAGLSAEAALEGEAIIYRQKFVDFIFEADVSFPAAATSGDAGLMFRATHPDEAQRGYVDGFYYAGVSPSSRELFLSRMPDNVQLASAKMDIQVKGPVHIKVQVVNETISVYVGDVSTPQLVQKDSKFKGGFNGVRGRNTGATFANVEVIPVVRQRGIIDNCNSFYRAVAGDTCQGIASKHDSTTLAQLHSWNPALEDDCSGLKTDYFYCVAREAEEDSFRLKTKYNSSCSGDVHNEVALHGNEGKCIDTGCSVGSLDVASVGDCPSGQVQISYWEQPGCSGKWFGYGYTSRDTCRSLWSNGWKFGSLHLRCADPWLDCVSLGTCVADEEPAHGICEAPPKDPPAAFKLKARSKTDCSGEVHKELSVEHGNGICLNTACHVGSLDIAELGDCPDGQVRISYWGGEECAGSWYGYGYASRNTCRTLWSGGSKFKSLWLSCAKQSDDCVSQKTCTADSEPARDIC